MIVDFCTGNGVIPLILTKRCKKNIIGVEIQEKLAFLAEKSVLYNNLEDRISIVCDDIKNFANYHLNEFDLVLCNPPYFKLEEQSTVNESYEKRIARHEILINLEEICACAKKVLKENGVFSIVHRGDRLVEIFSMFRLYGIEPKRIKFIYENLNREPTLVLIEGQKGGKVGLKIDKPLIKYNLDGKMTSEYLKLQKEVYCESKKL